MPGFALNPTSGVLHHRRCRHVPRRFVFVPSTAGAEMLRTLLHERGLLTCRCCLGRVL